MRHAAPDFLTVEEAAAVLRIGRTVAYAMTHEYLVTEGGSGLPCVKIGKQVRVVRALLEAKVGTAITWPIRPTENRQRTRIVIVDHDERREVNRRRSTPRLVS